MSKTPSPSSEALWRSSVGSPDAPWRALLEAAVDLTLLVDRTGLIKEVSVGRASPSREQFLSLKGRALGDVVGSDSRGKVDALLKVGPHTPAPPRELNLIVAEHLEFPFKFEAVRFEGDESVLLLGREQSAIAALQQRMVSLQQSMDREYSRLRQADTRYRVLFHVSAEAVLVAEASGFRVLEANPAAVTLTELPVQDLQRSVLTELLTPQTRGELEGLVTALESGGRRSEVLVKLKDTGREVRLSASLFRQGGNALVLVRMWLPQSGSTADSARAARQQAIIDAMPDAFVVTGEDRRVQYANPAFCELVQQASERQVVGESLDRWVGRMGVDINIMLANLREHGSIRNFSTIVRSDVGPPTEALVSAVQSHEGKTPILGFVIRQVTSRLFSSQGALPRSVEQLRELVGRVSLKDIVRESADLIEKMCIEAALDVSGNNRASAAQLLGLSRQGLYSKLRRYGLSEPESS
ncbi:MAG: transcriptional regulator PpsR [Myxococcaceae bacterium]|jgi:transcriptional regulator PpsR|nr:transcriptional regulator PpsR [Myxococcaceae bacterium]MCA3011001.1 transcriptional regulator PpsR [Myxococcaceae bacterium]